MSELFISQDDKNHVYKWIEIDSTDILISLDTLVWSFNLSPDPQYYQTQFQMTCKLNDIFAAINNIELEKRRQISAYNTVHTELSDQMSVYYDWLKECRKYMVIGTMTIRSALLCKIKNYYYCFKHWSCY